MIGLLNVLSGWRAKIVLKVQKLVMSKLENGFTIQFLTDITPNVSKGELWFVYHLITL
ncbi:hypothetical protein Anas_13521 [Armadillidium nasatum]|uniref:Uncharacterized protein n=1 Tax=Armadillidium nasatum TaxID=96803 RepID=A0A5N5STW4_9CRUS|nr:hypothetical protein Anas_13521 [Armadillidium nasatum]